MVHGNFIALPLIELPVTACQIFTLRKYGFFVFCHCALEIYRVTFIHKPDLNPQDIIASWIECYCVTVILTYRQTDTHTASRNITTITTPLLWS